MTDAPSTMSPDEKDTMMQRAALLLLMTSDVALLSDDEVVLVLADDPRDFIERDLVLRALRDLNAVGLVHRRNGFVQATRAAARAWQLLEH